MDFYLIEPSGPTLRLPINPTEVSVKGEKLIETVNILELGEVDLTVKGKRISEIAFSSFFPAEYDPSYCNYPDIPNPVDAIKQLLDWTDNHRPVRLLITKIDLNMLVIIATQVTNVRGGEPGDIYFDLTCRAWQEIRVRTTDEKSVPTRPDTRPAPKVYTVRSGDCLAYISKRELGTSARWKDIYAINEKTIGPDPNLIHPGQRLVMPV